MQNEAACVCAYIWALTNAQYTQHLFTQPQTIRLKKKTESQKFNCISQTANCK